jgi:predicted RNA binding protein YcfA (HicA-like mRNA interferase family)
MGRQEDKRIEKFKRFSNNYTYDELVWILEHFGFYEVKTGKTSGSKLTFENQKRQRVYVHRPHPGNVVKAVVSRSVYKQLLSHGINI